MKKLFNVIILTLAINFIAVACGVGWLRTSGHLDKDRAMAIKELLFPSTQPTAVAPATQPDDEQATTRPTLRLEELLAHETGRPATEQVEVLQHTFDTQTAQLDRRQRELTDLQRQVDLAKQQLTKDRGSLEVEKTTLETREQEAARLATDKGFQDSLELYKSMPAKQVKGVFMNMDDKTAAQFLSAMEPRAASKIVKEFKSPQEMQYIQKVLDRMRQPTAEVPTTAPGAKS